MQEKKQYVTAEGLRKIREEHERLRLLRMEFVRDEENLDELALLEKRMGDLEGVLQSYELIAPPSGDERGCVSLGATVSVSAQGQGKNHEFTIVGPLEANPLEGKISNESPVGKALMGRRAGDIVLVRTRKDVAYTIVSVSYHANVF